MAKKTRLKILKSFRRDRTRHRYDAWRTLGMGFSLSVLLLIPLSGLARIDLWRGNHLWLFRPAGFKLALAAVLALFTGIYVVTFLSNTVAGRMFCGWGCPVGQLSRFGENVDTPGLSAGRRFRARVLGALFSFALVVSSVAWWTDLRVFWRGSATALAVAWSAALLLSLLAYLHGRWWRWAFCRTTCPIGLYYSFVAPARWYGVYFRNEHSTCIECNLCDNVCPVDLAPRSLPTPIPSRGGLSIADAPGRNHCLECGDCVRACEWIIARKGKEPVPLLLGFHRAPDKEITRMCDAAGSTG